MYAACLASVVQVEAQGSIGLESLNISIYLNSQGQKQNSAIYMQCGVFQVCLAELITRFEEKPGLENKW